MKAGGIAHDPGAHDGPLQRLRHGIDRAHLHERDADVAACQGNRHRRQETQHEAQVGDHVEDGDDEPQEHGVRKSHQEKAARGQSPDDQGDGDLPPEVAGQGPVVRATEDADVVVRGRNQGSDATDDPVPVPHQVEGDDRGQDKISEHGQESTDPASHPQRPVQEPLAQLLLAGIQERHHIVCAEGLDTLRHGGPLHPRDPESSQPVLQALQDGSQPVQSLGRAASQPRQLLRRPGKPPDARAHQAADHGNGQEKYRQGSRKAIRIAHPATHRHQGPGPGQTVDRRVQDVGEHHRHHEGSQEGAELAQEPEGREDAGGDHHREKGVALPEGEEDRHQPEPEDHRVQKRKEEPEERAHEQDGSTQTSHPRHVPGPRIDRQSASHGRKVRARRIICRAFLYVTRRSASAGVSQTASVIPSAS